jgi:hypothetical protein
VAAGALRGRRLVGPSPEGFVCGPSRPIQGRLARRRP